ncbi:MAG TPA: M12 family metallo-peptidase [Candidatus Nitrosotenuis sp.]|nr:M12 family metallo-peptidase [Candidatus Nitrosotenuis sp.]
MKKFYEQNKNVFLGLIITSVVVSIIVPAYAISILGTVRDTSNNGLPDPKITAERVGEYNFARGSSGTPAGAYSVPVSTTNQYTVDAMKTSYGHNRLTNVAGGSTNQNFNLPARSVITVNVYLAADEEYRNANPSGWVTAATNKLKSAEPWFKEEHGIQFSIIGNSGTSWNSPAGASCNTLANDMIADIGWPGSAPASADFVFAVSGQSFTEQGCATNTTPTSHSKPDVTVSDNFSPGDLLVMHEITHIYDYDHQCNTGWYDIMEASGVSCNDLSLRIKNWKPSADDIMAANRSWY